MADAEDPRIEEYFRLMGDASRHNISAASGGPQETYHRRNAARASRSAELLARQLAADGIDVTGTGGSAPGDFGPDPTAGGARRSTAGWAGGGMSADQIRRGLPEMGMDGRPRDAEGLVILSRKQKDLLNLVMEKKFGKRHRGKAYIKRKTWYELISATPTGRDSKYAQMTDELGAADGYMFQMSDALQKVVARHTGINVAIPRTNVEGLDILDIDEDALRQAATLLPDAEKRKVKLLSDQIYDLKLLIQDIRQNRYSWQEWLNDRGSYERAHRLHWRKLFLHAPRDFRDSAKLAWSGTKLGLTGNFRAAGNEFKDAGDKFLDVIFKDVLSGFIRWNHSGVGLAIAIGMYFFTPYTIPAVAWMLIAAPVTFSALRADGFGKWLGKAVESATLATLIWGGASMPHEAQRALQPQLGLEPSKFVQWIYRPGKRLATEARIFPTTAEIEAEDREKGAIDRVKIQEQIDILLSKGKRGDAVEPGKARPKALVVGEAEKAKAGPVVVADLEKARAELTARPHTKAALELGTALQSLFGNARHIDQAMFDIRRLLSDRRGLLLASGLAEAKDDASPLQSVFSLAQKADIDGKGKAEGDALAAQIRRGHAIKARELIARIAGATGSQFESLMLEIFLHAEAEPNRVLQAVLERNLRTRLGELRKAVEDGGSYTTALNNALAAVRLRGGPGIGRDVLIQFEAGNTEMTYQLFEDAAKGVPGAADAIANAFGRRSISLTGLETAIQALPDGWRGPPRGHVPLFKSLPEHGKK